MKVWLFALLTFISAAAWTGSANAVLAAGPGAELAGLGSDLDAPAAPVSVSVKARQVTVKPGDEILLAVTFKHAPGYHTWPAEVTELPKDVAEFAIRTNIVVNGPPAIAAGGVRVQWPTPKPDKVPSPTGEGTLTVPLYSGDAVAFVALRAPMEPGVHEVSLTASFQACDESQCLMPEDKSFAVKVTVDPKAVTNQAIGSGTDALFAAYRPASDPPTPDASSSTPNGAGASSAAASSTASASAGALSTGGTGTGNGAGAQAPVPTNASIFGFNIGSGLLALFFFAAVGGFVLNLTPCVLPVIPIKVMTLTQHAASKQHALILGLWMAFGVVAFWAVIGVPMAFISASLDPSQFIFGTWWITLGIGLIVAVMGLGIMGLFTFNLPQAVYMVDAKADSPFGSFLFGVMTAVLGLPCFGFVAGGLLAGATTLPPFTIMAIFVGLGVGMAFPYLVLSIKPELLRFIPRTGPASELVKQVMGLLLLAAAAYFVAAAIKAVLHDYPYLSGSMKWWAVAFFVLVSGLWMTIRTWQIAKTNWPRIAMPILAVAMVGGIYIFAAGQLTEDRENYKKRQAAAAQAAPGVIPTGVWLEYTPELFAAVRKSGKAVFLDFTADWCINCKVLKRTILDQDPTRAALAGSDAVLLEVDLTSKKDAGWALLGELGRTGIPTWVVYGPAQANPVVLDLTRPTHSTVEQGLSRAGVAGAGGGGGGKTGSAPPATALR